MKSSSSFSKRFFFSDQKLFPIFYKLQDHLIENECALNGSSMMAVESFTVCSDT